MSKAQTQIRSLRVSKSIHFLALNFAIVIALLFSQISFAKISQATNNFDAAACRELLALVKKAKEIQKLKPELVIMKEALRAHVNAKGYTTASTARAVRTYVDIVDPLQLLLTAQEEQGLKNLSPEFLQAIHKEVFASNDRTYFAGILNVAIDRLNHLIDRFSKESAFRDQAMNLFLNLKAQLTVKGSLKNPAYESRPKNLKDMEDRFIESMAYNMLSFWAKSHSQNKDTPISDREALVLASRLFREKIAMLSADLNHDNLPLLIAKSYVTTLDPHSDVHLPRETSTILKSQSSNVVGIGVRLTPVTKGLKILSVIAGGPADTAGLKAGDIITHVTSDTIKKILEDSKSSKNEWLLIRNMVYDHATDFIMGTENTDVSLRIHRDNKIIETTVTRKRIDLAQSKLQIKVVDTPNGKIAQIQFESFYTGAAAHVRKELAEVLANHKIAGVALDLRGNPGGSVGELSQLLSIFMPADLPVFASVENKKIDVIKIKNDQPILWDGPMIVMTDSHSASASESIAGTLQDYGRAIVVGEKSTYGKGSMQRLAGINGYDNSTIRITVSLYYTPSGRSPQEAGIASDIVLESAYPDRVFERDLEGVLPVHHIESIMPAHESMIANKETIIKNLALKSSARQNQLADTGKKDDVKEQYDINTQESFAVLSDLIEQLSR
jgi:C-terminal peptidase prc